METKTGIDLPLLLPEIPDERDACVERLITVLANRPGIEQVHVIVDNGKPPALCMHYDPDVVPLSQVESAAKSAGAEVTSQFGHGLIALHAIDSEDAAKRIESTLRQVGGVVNTAVSLPAQRARVEFDRHKTSIEQIRNALRSAGYLAPVSPSAKSDGDDHDHGEHGHGWYSRNKELVWSIAAGALLAIAWAGTKWLNIPRGVAIIFFLASYLFGGFDLVRHAVATLRKGRFNFDIDLLMLLAAIGAAILGEWAEGAFLLFLFSLAHALEHYALGRARNAISALADLSPPVARVSRDGQEVEVPVEQVHPNEKVVIRPGERIPVDGTVTAGRSAVNQAPITGESVPAEKATGNDVFAGTINGDGALEVTTTRAAGDRTLDRVIKLVEEAQTQKAPTQQFTERFERVFVPVVLIADAMLILVPPLLGWWTWSVSFYRGMAMLVAASPCALALGTPSAVLAGIAQAARKGVLIKGGSHLENLGTLRALALDKTGTLTVGQPEVTDVISAQGSSEKDLLRVAGAVERRSQHPLAEAIVRRVDADKISTPEASELQSVTGKGVRSKLDGRTVEIGSLRMWPESTMPDDLEQSVTGLQVKGRSVMVVRYADQWLGVIGLADRPRENVRKVLDELRQIGLRPLVMLTGDNRGVGEAIGKEVGVDEVRAELLPEDKVTAIRELTSQYGQVAMIGDGVNDAPALANATVGIAMGGAGTAVALETADVALMGDDLGKLPFAVGLSRHARRVIRQNLYVSLFVIALLILATTTGWLGIGPAVFVHEGSTLVVITNSLRLLLYTR